MDLLTADCHGAQCLHVRRVHVYIAYFISKFNPCRVKIPS